MGLENELSEKGRVMDRRRFGDPFEKPRLDGGRPVGGYVMQERAKKPKSKDGRKNDKKSK